MSNNILPLADRFDRMAERQRGRNSSLAYVIEGLTIALLAETVWDKFAGKRHLQEHERRYHGQDRSR